MAQSTQLPWGQLAQFSEMLSACYQKNLAIEEGLNTVQKELEDNGLKAVVRRIAQLVESGHDIDKVFARFADHFPAFYLRVIFLAVAENRFREIFTGLASWCRGREIRARFWARVSLHPRIAIWITAIFVISMWLWTSRAILSVSHIVRMIFPLILISLIISWVYSILDSRERTPKQDVVLLKIPYLKNAYRTFLTAELAEKIGVLLPIGLPAGETINIVREFTSNQVIRSELADVIQGINHGADPGVALTRTVNLSKDLGTALKGYEHTDVFRKKFRAYQEDQSFEAQLQLRSTLGAVRAFSYGPAALIIILAWMLFFA